ncbi:MAG TPA: PAS domain-containing protein [Rhizomicrobium sp.]
MSAGRRTADPFRVIPGEMAERVRSFDWTKTPLGPIAQWPQSLKSAVSTVLLSPVPIVMLWGEDGIMIYNDGYSVFAGQRHPSLLGSKVREGWPEVADFNDNIMKVGLAGGTLAYRDFVLHLNRTGTFEPVWLDLDYSPLLGDDGRPAGVMAIVVEITERKRADEALRRSEEKLRLATENAGVGLWDIDAEGGIDFSYSRRSSPFVMDRENRVPMEHLLSRLHPEDAQKLAAAYAVARDPTQRAMMDMEYRVLPEDDQPLRWVKIRGRGVFDADGNCLRVSGTALDITRERETQEALARSEEQLRLATENAEIGMWDMDVVNGVNYSTPRVKAMFGFAPDDDAPSEAFFDLVHKDDIARVQAAYADAFDPQKRTAYDVEYRVTGRDGIERWVQAKGRGVFDANGRCVRVTGTAADITAERQTREALRRSEEQLRLATGHAEIGLWDVDNVANTLTWTKPVREAFGITHNGVVTLDDFYAGLHPDDLETTSEAFSSAMDPKKRALYDVEYRTIGQEDGVERWVHAKGRGLFDDAGRCVRVVGTTIDVTARKHIEREIRDLNETLEKRVAERTAALEKSQAALQQAQKMEAIGNLTGGIAHDFNNLLQGLTGSLDLIRNKPQDTERVRRWAEAGLQAAERGAKLTAQLLAFSRAQKLELKPLVLNTLLEEMRDLLGRTLGPSVHVRMDLSPEASTVLGDQTQLEMSVLNLAINARDAMGESGTLTIVTRPLTIVSDPELQPGDYVELRVSDTGTGMPADVLARAFDPFFTTKGVGKGTGLGLSQVYGMAQQAGGTARIGSEIDKGTAVSIFLRITSAEAVREARAGGEGVMKHARHAATVLVIDDDPDVRAFLTESLDAFGYAVSEAADGARGLEMIARQKPDILLVDYAMPGMTGAEVAARVRKIHADLPIIFASGYAETAALENVQDANTAILRKPFRLGELQEAVANALQRQSSVQ